MKNASAIRRTVANVARPDFAFFSTLIIYARSLVFASLFNRRGRRARAMEEMGLSNGSILAVGGAEDKVGGRDILERFVHEAGGPQSRIAIIPTASAIPDERAAFYREVFQQLGVAEAVHVPIATREDAQADHVAQAIEQSSGVVVIFADRIPKVAAQVDFERQKETRNQS